MIEFMAALSTAHDIAQGVGVWIALAIIVGPLAGRCIAWGES